MKICFFIFWGKSLIAKRLTGVRLVRPSVTLWQDSQ